MIYWALTFLGIFMAGSLFRYAGCHICIAYLSEGALILSLLLFIATFASQFLKNIPFSGNSNANSLFNKDLARRS